MTATPVSLTREEFDEHFAAIRVPGVNEELGWFSHRDLAGIITRDRVDADYGWVVLKRGENPDFPEQFTFHEGGCSLTSQVEAESALFHALWNARSN